MIINRALLRSCATLYPVQSTVPVRCLWMKSYGVKTLSITAMLSRSFVPSSEILTAVAIYTVIYHQQLSFFVVLFLKQCFILPFSRSTKQELEGVCKRLADLGKKQENM